MLFAKPWYVFFSCQRCALCSVCLADLPHFLMSAGAKLLVVTDLDGSLLDESYSWSAARPALARLRAEDVPLVLNSSKTVAEMTALAEDLDTHTSLVAENGGLIAVPTLAGEYRIELTGLSRAFILEKAHALRSDADYQFAGFADWTPEEVAECTSLPLAMARNSQSRYATEPILWDDSEARLLEFQNALAEWKIRIVRGGRFLHLMGAADKADGMAAVVQQFKEAQPEITWVVVALGDSENDCAMLEAADIAVVIPHPEGARIDPQAPTVLHAPQPSTKGWNATLLNILDQYD